MEMNDVLNGMYGKKIFVVGDIIYDEYLHCKFRCRSPESSSSSVLDLESVEGRLGGAANVAANIKVVGEPFLSGVVGSDAEGVAILKLLNAQNIIKEFGSYVVLDRTRPTTRKTRVMYERKHDIPEQQVVRVDREEKKEVSKEVRTILMKHFDAAIDVCDAVIISDYAKGVISKKLAGHIIEKCNAENKFVAVDPYMYEPMRYAHVNFICPNVFEAIEMGCKLGFHGDVANVGINLREKLNALVLLITRGEEGMWLCDGVEPFAQHISACKVDKPVDICGAGDTVVALYTLAKTAGATNRQAAQIAAAGASLVIQKHGASVFNLGELFELVSKNMGLK